MSGFARRAAAVGALMAGATALLDWWAVPLIGFAWGLLALPATRPGMASALGGTLAWLALLAWTGMQGSIVGVSSRVGGIMGIGGWGLIGAALLFPALLGGAAGVLGGAMRQSVSGRR